MFLKEILDSRAGFGCDVDSTVQNPRDSRHRHAGLGGDGGDSDPPSIGDGHDESPSKSHDTIRKPSSERARWRARFVLVERDVGHHAS
jgi:hypothetical protein